MYTVYKTTNLINSKFYIGVHKTKDPYDSYLGSGEQIKNAVRKYGRHNFKKEILALFESAEEAYAKEADLVTEELIRSNHCYNMNVGGFGKGIEVANQKGLNNSVGNVYKAHAKLKEMRKGGWKQPWNGTKTFEGKQHSEESKRKIGEANRIRQSGTKNSQFGTMWITNGSESKKIKKIESIPEGWRKGRK